MKAGKGKRGSGTLTGGVERRNAELGGDFLGQNMANELIQVAFDLQLEVVGVWFGAVIAICLLQTIMTSV